MNDVPVVSETSEELRPLYLVLRCAVLGLHALNGKGLFAFGEKFGLRRSIWEEEEDDRSEEYGGESLWYVLALLESNSVDLTNDEQPSPRLHAMLDLSDSIGQCSSEAISQG